MIMHSIRGYVFTGFGKVGIWVLGNGGNVDFGSVGNGMEGNGGNVVFGRVG
jgi:hypothetical protein